MLTITPPGRDREEEWVDDALPPAVLGEVTAALDAMETLRATPADVPPPLTPNLREEPGAEVRALIYYWV